MSTIPSRTSSRRPWAEPTVTELPPLTHLTLQTGDPPIVDAPFSYSLNVRSAIQGEDARAS